MIMKKKYIRFDSGRGYPSGVDLRYECILCGDVLLSIPLDNVSCKCGNIRIDVDSGRVAVNESSAMKIFRVKSE